MYGEEVFVDAEEKGVYWHMVGETPVVWDLIKIMFIGNSFTFFPSDLFSVDNPAVCALTKEIAASDMLATEPAA